MADEKEKIEDAAAKAEGPADGAEPKASKTGRASSHRWVRTCVNKSLAVSPEKDLADRRSAAEKTPWRRTRSR
jgi:hypothetical protein